MLDPGLVSFVTGALPPSPARVLEVGAGKGELAMHLTGAGYDVVAIDPASDSPLVRRVALQELDEPDASFDAALAVVSLHHVEPLEQSCERLAALLRPEATLVIDEFDIGALDPAAMRWRLARNPGHAGHGGSPESIVQDMQSHLHPLSKIVAALDPWFELGPAERLAYLYRWELGPALQRDEAKAIARGEIPATGARLVGRRRHDPLRTPR